MLKEWLDLFFIIITFSTQLLCIIVQEVFYAHQGCFLIDQKYSKN